MRRVASGDGERELSEQYADGHCEGGNDTLTVVALPAGVFCFGGGIIVWILQGTLATTFGVD